MAMDKQDMKYILHKYSSNYQSEPPSCLSLVSLCLKKISF